MDIFTTQLTRVVQTPIKPTQLKVKALVKDAAATKLKEDPDHLENHEYYFQQGDSGGNSRDKEQANDPNSKKKEAKSADADSTVANEELNEKSAAPAQLLIETPAHEEVEYCPNGKTDPTPEDEDEHKGKNLDLYA